LPIIVTNVITFTMNPSLPTTRTLLHIDASPRGDRSHSRKLGRDFVSHWQASRPAGRVVARDIGHEPPPFVTAAWVEGAFAPAEQHSPAAREAIAVSNRYVDELLAADEILITTPIYNLSLPAALKAWIDQIVRAGRTFRPAAGSFEGLAGGKRVVVIVASGSDFRPHTPGSAYNFLEPYLRAVLGFIGITDVEFVYAHSLNQGSTPAVQALADAQATLAQLAIAA
jgi:FMN-dependent NADH-azoreductase